MIKSKINPSQVKDLKWKEYVKLFQKDITTAKNNNVKKVPVVLISNFTFACGETHALILLGKQSMMTKFFKSLKGEEERKKQKDYAIGFCHFEKDEKGVVSIKIAMKGFGKPAQMTKNSKKLINKLDVSLKEIIKGEYVDEVVAAIDEENASMTEEQKAQDTVLEGKAKSLKEADDKANDSKTLMKVANEFTKIQKIMNKEVVSLLKLAQSESVIYSEKHIKVAEDAFRAAASLVDKYEEVRAKRKNLAKTAVKITALKENIVKNNLVKKYETIWKKVRQGYDKQMNELSEPLRAKFDQLNSLFDEIRQELAQ